MTDCRALEFEEDIRNQNRVVVEDKIDDLKSHYDHLLRLGEKYGLDLSSKAELDYQFKNLDQQLKS